MNAFRLLLVLAFASSQLCRADDFALRDGDTVVYLGDSITAARTYGKLIENYTLLRFPERKVHFLNAGRGGETAEGALKRFDQDVLDRGATVVTVAYGVNDIGWGLKADAEHRQRYLDGIRGIVKRCRARGVRVYICSAAVTAADPVTSEQSFLQTMCDDGMALSRELGGEAIDLQRTMRDIQRRIAQDNEQLEPDKRSSLHVADGIHLNPLGQVAMAYAILKGLGAPADVSSASIDAKTLNLIEAAGCEISDIKRHVGGLEFTRLDAGLPLNGETFFPLHFRYVPIPEQLNRYLLKVKSLPPGRYELSADGRQVSSYTAEQLAAGVNIASATTDGWQPGGPWDAQANILNSLTEARDKADLAALLSKAHLPGQDLSRQFLADSQRLNAQMEDMQRLIARPRPYRFRIQRSDETAEKNPATKSP